MIGALSQPLGLGVHDGSAGTDQGSAILDTFKRLTELLEHTRKDMRKHQVNIIIALTVVIIPILGRIARGATLTWINREFVVAARSMGMRDKDIIVRHIVPNVLPAIYSVLFLAIGVVIVAEGALSLLGVGVVDGVSWGAMIARVAGEFTYAPQSMYVPVVVVALTVIACNQLGDFLRGRLDLREGKI